MSLASYVVRAGEWSVDRDRLRGIRHRVFVVEQQVPETLEWDAMDALCRHALAEDETGAPIGTGRLLPDGHIGRIAVLAPWRRRGVGSAIVEHLMAAARGDGHREVALNAQVHAIGFYRRFGFVPAGVEFEEAGIAHREMRASL